MTDRFPSGIDHYDFGDELSRLERASRFHEWTENFFDEGPHLVACPELPWGDEVRHRSIEAYERFVHGETWITGGGAREMEAEIVSWMGGILGAAEPAGFVTSGGSESNMCAILAGRERSGITTGGSLVYPANAHYSVPKLCRMFGLEPIVVPSVEGSLYEVDVEAYAAAIRSDTVALFTTAGTWAYGTVDPIEAIGEIALERDLHLHVDGAFGGYILPFLERSGYDTEIPLWDFRVPGVSTISADLHKNGMAPPPAGTLFFRDASVLDYAKAVCPPNGTMTGTRGTGPIAGAWTMVKLLGDEGYQAVSLKSMALRDELIAGATAIEGLSIYPGTRINIALIVSDELDLRPVATELRDRGWMFSARAVPEPVSIVVVPMPHNHGQVEPFLHDLNDAMGLAVPFDGAGDGVEAGPVSQYGF